MTSKNGGEPRKALFYNYRVSHHIIDYYQVAYTIRTSGGRITHRPTTLHVRIEWIGGTACILYYVKHVKNTQNRLLLGIIKQKIIKSTGIGIIQCVFDQNQECFE